MKKSLLLGSSSPRRKELLSPYFKLNIAVADIDETPKRKENPKLYVKRMAREKWIALADRRRKRVKSSLLLTADTTVVQAGKILGKPETRKEAARMLKALSGKSHWVWTAVALGDISRNSPQKIILVGSRIFFKKLSREELALYLRSGEWQGKAGAYGIQGLAGGFVKRIEGSLSSVIGLPVAECLEWIDRHS